MNKRPPARLLAEPTEPTLQSTLSPCRAPAAGTMAVTSTKATFLVSLRSAIPVFPSGLPIYCMTEARLRSVGRDEALSPVPFSPTTIPSPCRVFSSCPLSRQIVFNIIFASTVVARRHSPKGTMTAIRYPLVLFIRGSLVRRSPVGWVE